MVTPFLVRLSVNELSGVGGTAGTLYAVSTAGSIAGTFAVAFILPELIGTMATIWGVGVLLAILAIICFWNKTLHNVLNMIVASGTVSAAFFFTNKAEGRLAAVTNFPRLPAGHALRKAEKGSNICFRESAYHNINIFESQLNYDTATLLHPPFRARYMMFNQQVESGCLIRDGKVIRPIQTACGYVRLFPCGILVSGKIPRKIAMLGSGGGVGVQLLADDYPETERIDVVDIDRTVFELAGKYFDYPYPDKAGGVICNHVTDGRRFLTGAANGEYDLIIMDVFTSGGRVPEHLVTEEFFKLASAKISGEGTLTINLIGNINSPDERFLPAVIKTLQKVFRHVYIFPRDLSRCSNVMIVCTDNSNRKLTKRELLDRFDSGLGTLFKQNIRQVVENYTEVTTKSRDIPVLTDDFCPADVLATL
jgi:spermidine synthase